LLLGESAEITSLVVSNHLLIQIVYFYKRNAGGIVYTPHDRRVVARWQLCDDRRFPAVAGSVAAS
jgi:hypothetical protein